MFFLASAALAAMTGLQNTRIRNMPKEPDMTCEDNLAEEKEQCEEEKKGTYWKVTVSTRINILQDQEQIKQRDTWFSFIPVDIVWFH